MLNCCVHTYEDMFSVCMYAVLKQLFRYYSEWEIFSCNSLKAFFASQFGVYHQSDSFEPPHSSAIQIIGVVVMFNPVFIRIRTQIVRYASGFERRKTVFFAPNTVAGIQLFGSSMAGAVQFDVIFRFHKKNHVVGILLE